MQQNTVRPRVPVIFPSAAPPREGRSQPPGHMSQGFAGGSTYSIPWAAPTLMARDRGAAWGCAAIQAHTAGSSPSGFPGSVEWQTVQPSSYVPSGRRPSSSRRRSLLRQVPGRPMHVVHFPLITRILPVSGLRTDGAGGSSPAAGWSCTVTGVARGARFVGSSKYVRRLTKPSSCAERALGSVSARSATSPPESASELSRPRTPVMEESVGEESASRSTASSCPEPAVVGEAFRVPLMLGRPPRRVVVGTGRSSCRLARARRVWCARSSPRCAPTDDPRDRTQTVFARTSWGSGSRTGEGGAPSPAVLGTRRPLPPLWSDAGSRRFSVFTPREGQTVNDGDHDARGHRKQAAARPHGRLHGLGGCPPTVGSRCARGPRSG